jgi:hypothetical protein
MPKAKSSKPNALHFSPCHSPRQRIIDAIDRCVGTKGLEYKRDRLSDALLVLADYRAWHGENLDGKVPDYLAYVYNKPRASIMWTIETPDGKTASRYSPEYTRFMTVKRIGEKLVETDRAVASLSETEILTLYGGLVRVSPDAGKGKGKGKGKGSKKPKAVSVEEAATVLGSADNDTILEDRILAILVVKRSLDTGMTLKRWVAIAQSVGKRFAEGIKRTVQPSIAKPSKVEPVAAE